jgi:hypothetical protein
MPKEISSSHEGRDQRPDAPTRDGARYHGKVPDFATRPQTYRYAKGDFFTLRSGERVPRLRGGADDDANYGDLYNTGGYGGSSDTGGYGWYGDSSNSGGYGDYRWQEDPYRYDPSKPEDLDKYENPFDRWGKEPASTSDSYSEAIKLLDEWKIKTSYESSEQAIKQLEEWRIQLREDSIKDASELLYEYNSQMHDDSNDDSNEDAIKLFNELRSQMHDDSNKDAIKLFNELRSQMCDASGRSSQGGYDGGGGSGDGGHRVVHGRDDSSNDEDDKNGDLDAVAQKALAERLEELSLLDKPPYTDPSNLENPIARSYAMKMENAISHHLNPDDLRGAWRDMHGDPVPNPNKPGEFYRHFDEVQSALYSCYNVAEKFPELLEDSSISSGDRSLIQFFLSRASKTIDYVEKVIYRDQWFSGARIPPRS